MIYAIVLWRSLKMYLTDIFSFFQLFHLFVQASKIILFKKFVLSIFNSFLDSSIINNTIFESFKTDSVSDITESNFISIGWNRTEYLLLQNA